MVGGLEEALGCSWLGAYHSASRSCLPSSAFPAFPQASSSVRGMEFNSGVQMPGFILKKPALLYSLHSKVNTGKTKQKHQGMWRGASGVGSWTSRAQIGGILNMTPFNAPSMSGAIFHPCSLPAPVPTSGLFPQLWEESEAQGTEDRKPLELCLRERGWSAGQTGAQGSKSVNAFFPGTLCHFKGLRGPWQEGQTLNALLPSPPGASPSGT